MRVDEDGALEKSADVTNLRVDEFSTSKEKTGGYASCVARLTTEHIHIITISAQEVDNVIPTQVWVNLCVGSSRVVVIEATGNIGIYRPHVFRVRYGPNQ